MAEKENRQFGPEYNIQPPSSFPPAPTRPPPPPPRPPPNILNIRFDWEDRHSKYPPGDRRNSLATTDQDSLEDYTFDGRRCSTPSDYSPRDGGTSPGLVRRLSEARYPAESSPTSSGYPRTSPGSPALTPLRIPRISIPSVLSFPSRDPSAPIHGVEYHLITKPPLDSAMPRQSAFIYMDKDAVISILTTLDYANPVMMEVYLHTQLSLVAGATRSCEITSLSDFLEGFMDPLLDPILTNKLQQFWWSLECTLPNGVIIIHSLARSSYKHVYIFKFSPVTGVFCKLVPQEVSDMRAYLEHHKDDYQYFPRIPGPLKPSNQQKLRAYGSSLASRSVSSLSNLLSPSVSRRMSVSSFGMGTSFSGSLLNGIKNNIIPTLMSWNGVHYNERPSGGLTSLPNTTTSDLSKHSDENRPTSSRSRRPSFFRTGSSSYLRHPLQTLRHHGSSFSLIPSLHPSEDSLATITPTIILTTPEHNNTILKLKAAIPRDQKDKGFWQSMGESLTPKKPERPTFVFWKDVFDQISFETEISHKTSSFPLELDTNINQQVAENLNRLLTGVTEMYIKDTEGMQLDFIRMKLHSNEDDQSLDIRMFKGSREPPMLKTKDSFSTILGTPTISTVGDIKDKPLPDPKDTADEQDFDELYSESSHGSIALSDEAEPTEEEIRRQGQMLANNLKPDQKLNLNFDVSELEFSSILLSQDVYLVEAVLAGWFADAAEWYNSPSSCN